MIAVNVSFLLVDVREGDLCVRIYLANDKVFYSVELLLPVRALGSTC